MNRVVLRHRQVLIILALAGIIAGSLAGAFCIRFEFAVPPVEMYYFHWGVLLALFVKLPVFYITRLHRGWISFSGLEDLRRIVQSVVLACGAFAAATHLTFSGGFPRSIYVLDFFFTLAFVCWLRVLIRMARESRYRAAGSPKRALIYGAGSAGTTLAKELASTPKLGYMVAGFIDDAPHMHAELILGIPVLGSGEDIGRVVARFEKRGHPIDEILIAIPGATHDRMSILVSYCRVARVKCKTLPAYSDLLQNDRLSTQIRDIKLEDLLSRESVVLEEDNIRASIANKSVLITGAAGSIGSELADRVAEFKPAKVILFDNAESGIFRVDMALRQNDHEFSIHPVIGDIRDYRQVETIIRQHGVATIFHAAAYKHVPLMELHAVQAAENNVIGTWNLAEAAYKNGVGSFTLISSDKAVNPTNVMGATKRVAELIISSFPPNISGATTRFTAVRFGNVLGSNGSVVPTFQWQIARGGPVTVTHEEATRYFMTVREAVQLVLQASTMSKGADIFVLDMGEPVRIVDLARNVIRLAGFVPDVDIPISFTGLRPGEKLFEELIAAGENVAPTYHDKIKIFTGPPADRGTVEDWIARLKGCIARDDAQAIVELLSELVPEYDADPTWRTEGQAPGPEPSNATGRVHSAAIGR